MADIGKGRGIQIWEGRLPPLGLKYPRTFLKAGGGFWPEGALIADCFEFLDNRILVVSLLTLKDTAAKCKNQRDRELTLETCGTLYLPVYNEEMLWLRRGKETTALLRAWREELERCDGWLALTRAMHRVQPLAWYLPPIGG